MRIDKGVGAGRGSGMVQVHECATPWARAREAARELGARCAPPWAEVPLATAIGATLARGLTATVGVPPHDAAAMDGYAVAGSGPWRVLGQVLAGPGAPVAGLCPGEAVEIATGAPVPCETTSVLPYESARPTGEWVEGDIAPGRHVRRAGEDIPSGTEALAEGTVVTPATLGLAASLGHDTLPVRRPRVSALVTGDELATSGRPAQGTVRDAIGPMLPGMVAWAGAAMDAPAHVGDDRSAMVDAVRTVASGNGAGVLVVCGASSRGPADHLRGALGALGATMLVDGVACRPGHPQLLARVRPGDGPGGIVVGLPGNPNAALAAALTLLVPLLAAMAGRADPSAAAPWHLPLAGEVQPHRRDTRLVAVRVSGESAEPVGHDRPGNLRGASLADALAVVPPGWRGPSASLVWLPR